MQRLPGNAAFAKQTSCCSASIYVPSKVVAAKIHFKLLKIYPVLYSATCHQLTSEWMDTKCDKMKTLLAQMNKPQNHEIHVKPAETQRVTIAMNNRTITTVFYKSATKTNVTLDAVCDDSVVSSSLNFTQKRTRFAVLKSISLINLI